MGYRIEYNHGNGKYEISKEHPYRFPLILAGSLTIFLMFMLAFRPEETAALRSILIPREDAVTVQAIQNMTDDLRSGASVSDAVEAFCRFVIHGK